MKIRKYQIEVFGEECSAELMSFDKSDREKWKALFDSWRELKFGLREFHSREPNFPEGLSEVAFCLYSGSQRLVSLTGPVSSSFDTYNLKTKKAEQIKATSVEEDLTSFGPNSKWDDLYFLDFFNTGKMDGTFNIYKVPNKLIYAVKVNKRQTFKDQQKEKRRPRFSVLKKIIRKTGLNPLEKNVKVW